MEKSAIIIGGGLGGLFTGAILSKENIKVTVIEKNVTVGGGLQSFTRFGEVYDTGMHVIGGMQKGGNIRKICDYLGIMDRVHLSHVDSNEIDTLYFAEDKTSYRIVQGRDNFVNCLAGYFPDSKEELTKYVDALYNNVEQINLFYLRPENRDYIVTYTEDFMISANALIDKYISNKKLRSVLAYMNPLYGGCKDITPAYIHSLISVLYINGPSRFAGGSHLFANVLRDYIIEHGGEVIVGDGVERVYSQEKSITEVKTRKGKVLKADYYICAIHPCTFLKLLDDPTMLPKSYRDRLNEIPNTYSAFTLNLKLKPNSFKYMNHTAYYMSAYNEIWSFDRNDKEWPLGFLYMTPPELEQGEYSNKIIITAPMVWDKVKQWEDTTVGRRGVEYEEWKKDCAERLLDKMEEIYPNFRNCIEAMNTASPLTIRDYYGVKEGAMCGYLKDCNNMTLSRVPVVTKSKNLFLTGQNCGGHGFCGVPLTAISTCEAILGRNYILNKINGVTE